LEEGYLGTRSGVEIRERGELSAKEHKNEKTQNNNLPSASE
jgi:hypothetical protein